MVICILPKGIFKKCVCFEGEEGYSKKRTKAYRERGSFQRTYARPYNFNRLLLANYPRHVKLSFRNFTRMLPGSILLMF